NSDRELYGSFCKIVGGVVSPLLANIALNGIESIHRYHVEYKRGNRITDKTPTKSIVEPSIRYADDMVIILRPEDEATEILERISEFLRKRGMNVSQKKTKQDLRNCHKQWRGVAAPCAKQLGNKHGNIRTF
ncbi:reverse transcriptase domain-containing protein, partial [Nostoc sp. PCC 9305]|uniref:reverse transcriptase domain-containing protein n=1 Tax=Nostoc sp. PCC 9305 TaxID=296636 RepID=UPI0039C68CCA